jgi:hypothetical protein
VTVIGKRGAERAAEEARSTRENDFHHRNSPMPLNPGDFGEILVIMEINIWFLISFITFHPRNPQLLLAGS